jgi:arylsulfatase A-like enzyme
MGLAGTAGLAGASIFGNGFAQGQRGTPAAGSARRPNVIIFHTDDQDFNTIGCYGAHVFTPHIDSLADRGIRFTRGYVPIGVCMPSRYALITGQYPSRCRHPSFQKAFPKNVPTEPSFNTPLVDGQHTIANVLKKAGYATGFVGKWHIGAPDPAKLRRLPVSKEWAAAWKPLLDDLNPRDPEVNRILEQNHRVHSEHIKSFGFDYADRIMENTESFNSRSINYHNPEWVTEGALEFINQSRDKPFFLYCNHTLHHIPHPQESLFNADPRVTLAGYLDKVPDVMPSRREIVEMVKREGFPEKTAFCTWMDLALGALLTRLAELNLTDNTLIIFYSDNNIPAKGTIYEDGVNVPCIFCYPRDIPSGRHSGRLIQNIDLAPTIFSLCGVPKPADMQVDGSDAMPLLTGQKERIHDELFFEIGWSRACCTEQFKYLAVRPPASAEEFRKSKGGAFPWIYHSRALEPQQHHALIWLPAFFYPDQLYDLSVDRDELVNLSEKKEHAATLNDMKGRMRRWLRTFDHPFGEFTG